jgi:hypothetical protein
MIKTQKHISTFSSGIDQDTSVNKAKNTFIFDAENMRIISNDLLSSGAETNVKGNQLSLIFDVGDEIIGYCKIRSVQDPGKDDMVFFAYNSNSPTSKIYLFQGDPYLAGTDISMGQSFQAFTVAGYTFSCGYIYANSLLAFNPSYPIKAEGRFESNNIRKIYWVDGLNSIRYMILDEVQSTDPVTIFDINPSVVMEIPTVEVISGGSYTAGSVQYSYQLYTKHGATTTFAPVSSLVMLAGNSSGSDSRYFGGNNLGDNTGKAIRVSFVDLDQAFDRIRIVAIHYTEYLIDPVINIVGELEYLDNSITFVDNGYTTYGTIPIDEFRLFGQTTFIADSLASKFNYLFYGNITETRWQPDWLDPDNVAFYDCRVVRFNDSHVAVVYDNDTGAKTITQPSDETDPVAWITAGWDDTFPISHDAINNFNNTDNDGNAAYEYKYMSNGFLGAEGPNLAIIFENEYFIIDKYDFDAGYYSDINYNMYPNSAIGSQHVESQRTEVYRMYIVFYNTKMQVTAPQWIGDIRMPSNSDIRTVQYDALTGIKNGYNIYPRVAIRNIPTDSNLYGWQIFRCERDSVDRSVLASGVISGMAYDTLIDGATNIARPYSNYTSPYCFIRAEDNPVDVTRSMVEIISPEICFNKDIKYVSGDYVRVDGRYDTHTAEHNHDLATDNLLVTVSLGSTDDVNATDVIVNVATDAMFQSPGIINTSTLYPPKQLIGTIPYVHVARFDDYYSNRGTSFAVALASPLSVNATTTGFIMGSYIRNVFNTQYGGNTYEARGYNSIIPYSDIVPKATSSIRCYRGDAYITMFAYLRASKPNLAYDANTRYQQEMVYIPCESSINCYYRLDKIQKYYDPAKIGYALQETIEQGLVLEPVNYPLELGDLYRYNPVYSKSGNANMIQNTVFDSNNIQSSDVKIIATGKKINNEYFDNWTNLYTNNYIELDPKYGAIRNIFNLNNKLFVGQDKAIAVVAVNDRSVIQDNNKSQLTLGTGGVLERYDYLTTNSGFQNYFDVCLSDKTFYYLDRRNKIIYQLTENGEKPISEIEGYRSFLKSYDIITEVYTGYDPVYKEVFFYISDGVALNTSIFNEYTNSFNGRHTFIPYRMLNLNDQFYSISDNNMWLHNYGDYGNFYGSIGNSTLTIIINPSGTNVNKYDVLELRMDVIDTDGQTYLEDEQFDHIWVVNNYQVLNKDITFDPTGLTEDTSKSIIRKWRIPLIPDSDSTEVMRLVDTYIKVKFIRYNTGNKKIVFHDLTTYYRPTKA